jgi:hypothetical protein
MFRSLNASLVVKGTSTTALDRELWRGAIKLHASVDKSSSGGDIVRRDAIANATNGLVLLRSVDDGVVDGRRFERLSVLAQELQPPDRCA